MFQGKLNLAFYGIVAFMLFVACRMSPEVGKDPENCVDRSWFPRADEGYVIGQADYGAVGRKKARKNAFADAVAAVVRSKPRKYTVESFFKNKESAIQNSGKGQGSFRSSSHATVTLKSGVETINIDVREKDYCYFPERFTIFVLVEEIPAE